MIPMNGDGPPTLRFVVLAAGFSARLGHPKALARVRGVSLLRRTLGVLAACASTRLIVVIPPRSPRYRLASGRHRVEYVTNSRRACGLSSTVRAGLRRARHSSAVMLLPVDLVDLDTRDVARLISRWRGARRKVIARTVSGGPATPLILPRLWFARASSIRGDRGLREFVGALPAGSVRLVNLPSAGADVDTREDLARARRRLKPAPAAA